MLIHYDRNIFLKQNGDIKLGDFVSVRLANNSSNESLASIDSLSSISNVLYMSPEMRESTKYSYNTDCWLAKFLIALLTIVVSDNIYILRSAGCTVYEMISLETFYVYNSNTYRNLSDLNSYFVYSSDNEVYFAINNILKRQVI